MKSVYDVCVVLGVYLFHILGCQTHLTILNYTIDRIKGDRRFLIIGALDDETLAFNIDSVN